MSSKQKEIWVEAGDMASYIQGASEMTGLKPATVEDLFKNGYAFIRSPRSPDKWVHGGPNVNRTDA